MSYDLFFDGVPLHHVNSSTGVNRSGTWHWDAAACQIVFFVALHGGSLAGHVVELSVTTAAVGEAKSQQYDTPGVTVANMTVQMYANPAQSGAIGGPPGTNWRVDNVVATLNHGAGVQVRDSGLILNSKLLRNGQHAWSNR